LRAGEIVHLKAGDIDSAQMFIRNVQYPLIPCEMKNDWRHNVAALGARSGETRLLLCQWSKRRCHSKGVEGQPP